MLTFYSLDQCLDAIFPTSWSLFYLARIMVQYPVSVQTNDLSVFIDPERRLWGNMRVRGRREVARCSFHQRRRILGFFFFCCCCLLDLLSSCHIYWPVAAGRGTPSSGTSSRIECKEPQKILGVSHQVWSILHSSCSKNHSPA